MALTVATWNVNSVRLREGLVCDLLAEARPDVLCLQECKAPVALIPRARFAALGYPHLVARGQKGYNGVAILSRLPLEDVGHLDFCGRGDARHVAARLPDGTVVHNLYVPAGGDVPDPGLNPKFAHKLDLLAELRARFAADSPRRAVLVGDLNVAPREDDVWSHRQLLGVVSHTPVEVDAFEAAREAGGWADAVRAHLPSGPLFSWWSYRARDWEASDRGRRLDHLWVSADLAGAVEEARVLRHVRGWPRGSDHAPVLVRLDL